MHTDVERDPPEKSGQKHQSAARISALLPDISIPDRFQEIVNAVPDDPAIVDGEKWVSYAALDAWSDQIAGRLLGVPGSPVVLLCEHGPAVLAAILGTLKAGQIYCVVDPAMPTARITHILADLDAQFLLTDDVHAILAQQVARPGDVVIGVDSLAHSWSPVVVPPQPQPTDPAAIYYSSGTTGQPKGTVRDHAALVHRAWVDVEVVSMCPGDRVAWLYSAAYSASVSDIFGPLLNGATIYVYHLEQGGGGDLAYWVEDKRINFLHLHASVLRQLLDSIPDTHIFHHLRYVRPSDRITVNDLRRLRQHLPAAALIVHSLGSSETGPICRFLCAHDTPLDGEIVPVGHPVTTAQVSLVDEAGALVEGEGIGEIVVRSRYLAHGYWRQPDLTVQRFTVDLVDPRYRIFRMGDLARRRPDGMLELLGRKDRRVKIRGYSVDLGVVEAALSALPGMTDAVVVVQGEAEGASQFIAYVVGALMSPQELRSLLSAELPAYMLPTRIISLDKLPRQPNGKVDQSALPLPGTARLDLDTLYIAPRTELEQQIAEIWGDVLAFDVVGIDDNFFDLGGNSIQAMRIVSRVAALTHIHIPLSALFAAPTVATQAIELTERQLAGLAAHDLALLMSEVDNLPQEPLA